MPPLPHPTVDRHEQANAASHGLGLLAALWTLAALGSGWEARLAIPAPLRAGLWVFALTMGAVFAASMAFHACADGPWRRRLQRADHAAIYLFMAGTYTPFALRDVPGGTGWLVFGAVWALAAVGVAAKLLDRLRHKGLSTALYLAFGWVLVAAARPALASLPPWPLTLVVLGGLAYGLGTVCYMLDRRWALGHLAWHLCVLTGCACHGAAVACLTLGLA